MKFEPTKKFALELDAADPLATFRKQFNFPKSEQHKVVYFAGNSLGLSPKNAKTLIDEELLDWAHLGVEGHFKAKRPWVGYHKQTKQALARVVGAKPFEVVAMNQLTVNLHLMLMSFYRPTTERFKIITEANAFSSDQYAIQTHLQSRGLDPEKVCIEVHPRSGEHLIRHEDIVDTIDQHRSSVALTFFGGVHYYTGQFFDIKGITDAAHQAGAMVGFDLAHAVGNVDLHLHDHAVDFAVWCSYKYLNAGPGSIAGIFVHERHGKNPAIPRFAGWWGHREADRFQMKKGFVPMSGADGWQISNVPVLSSAPLLASMNIFQAAGMQAIRKKSIQLTSFLEFLLQYIPGNESYFDIITPHEPRKRGCQLSLLMKKRGAEIYRRLTDAGVVGDWREPNVIRVAPAPLYNSYEDVYTFYTILHKIIYDET